MNFRLLDESDFSLIEKWLHKEHVRRWYEIPSMGITIEDWMQEIKAYKVEFKWITYQIVMWENQPIGMCLYYRCKDSEGEVLLLPDAKRVTADVDPNNIASRKTLEACGFTLVPTSGARYVKEN